MLYNQRVRKIHPVDFESDSFGLSAELTAQGYHRIFFPYVEMMMMRVKRNSWSNDWCCNSCNFNFVSLPPAHAPIYFGEVKNARPFEGEISCNLWRMHVRMLLQHSSSKWNRSTCTRTAKHGCKQLIFADHVAILWPSITLLGSREKGSDFRTHFDRAPEHGQLTNLY